MTAAHTHEDQDAARCVTTGQRFDLDTETFVTHTLTSEGFDASEDGTGRGTPMTPANGSLRRLTPTECERLQSFPDGWTHLPEQVGDESNPKPDSHRYAMMGNAVTVNVAEWIGRRIMAEAA